MTDAPGVCLAWERHRNALRCASGGHYVRAATTSAVSSEVLAQHEQIPSEIFSVVVPWDSTASTTLRPSGPEHNSLAFTTDPIISPCLSILSLLFS